MTTRSGSSLWCHRAPPSAYARPPHSSGQRAREPSRWSRTAGPDDTYCSGQTMAVNFQEPGNPVADDPAHGCGSSPNRPSDTSLDERTPPWRRRAARGGGRTAVREGCSSSRALQHGTGRTGRSKRVWGMAKKRGPDTGEQVLINLNEMLLPAHCPRRARGNLHLVRPLMLRRPAPGSG